MSETVQFVSPTRLEIERRLPASCQRVWEYLTDPELRKQWFCGGATGSAPGEDFVMAFDHTNLSTTPPPTEVNCGEPMTMVGKIVDYEPPHLLSYEWPDFDEPSKVIIRLEPDGDHTRLHLTHERLEKTEHRLGAAAGWHAHLDLLVDLTNDLPARDFWLHYNALKAKYTQSHESQLS